MLQDDVREGVSSVGKAGGFDRETIERISEAIITEALSAERGRDALALSSEGDYIVHYNLFKAITAAASVFGAALTISLPATLPPVLAAIGALGALSGLREPLPQSSAAIILLLHAEQSKSLSRETLVNRFGENYDGPREEMKHDFDKGFEALERLKSIRQDRGMVRLKEFVVLRSEIRL
jgi:hypothetical protein